MKKLFFSLLLGCAVVTLSAVKSSAQLPVNPRSKLPSNFAILQQGEYNRLEEPEVTFPAFYDVAVTRYYHDDALKLDPSLIYPVRVAPKSTVCGNGDFEAGLNSVEWQGGYGSVSGSGDVQYSTFAAGLAGGAINLGTSRQTLVPDGIDPYVGIHTVAPTGSTQAVRIGNAVSGNGAELLSKTFVVPSDNSILTFWYALVLQSPQDHNITIRPGFRVRVLDAATNTEILGTVDLGNGGDEAIADTANPFFVVDKTKTITYRNWSCAQINLSKYIGKRVIVQFVTKDCGAGAHWGYAYVDDFCGTCKGNNYNLEQSKVDCDRSMICFGYKLPAQSGVTGNVNISLNIYQNGVLMGTQTSGVLTSGSTYCFTVDPGILASLDPSYGGYDYTAVGNFAIGGSTLSPIYLYTPAEGALPGRNNDCGIVQTKQCCPGTNLVINGGFEAGNTGFSSGYAFQPAIGAGSVTPGQYAILTDAQAAAVSTSWNPNCSAFNRHLVVNGYTGAGGTRTVWSQTIAVKPGQTYKFCGDFKNLPQCGFSVNPRVIVQIINAPGQSVYFNATTGQVIDLPNVACNWVNIQQSATIPDGLNAVQINVILDESSVGDGNDLAVDNFSFIQLQPAAGADIQFGLMPFNMTSSTYSMTATATAGLARGCENYWEVEELDANYLVIGSTQVINPAAWVPLTTNTFNGYVGTSSLSGSAPGVFSNNKTYRFVYGRSCTCTGIGKRYYIYGPLSAKGGTKGGPQLLDSGELEPGKDAPVQISDKVKTSVKVYPNPTNNVVTIQKSASDQDYTVNIFNTYGQLVKTVNAKAADTKTEVSLSEYAPGSYMLQVVSNQGTIIHTEKVTKL